MATINPIPGITRGTFETMRDQQMEEIYEEQMERLSVPHRAQVAQLHAELKKHGTDTRKNVRAHHFDTFLLGPLLPT